MRDSSEDGTEPGVPAANDLSEESPAIAEEALSGWCRQQLRRFNRKFAWPLITVSWLNFIALLGISGFSIYALTSRQLVLPPLLLNLLWISIMLLWAALPLALVLAHAGFRAIQPPPELAICFSPATVYAVLIREGRRSMRFLPLQLLLPALLLRLLQPAITNLYRSDFQPAGLLEGLLSALTLLCAAYVAAEMQLAFCLRLAPREANRLLLAVPGIVVTVMSLVSTEGVYRYWGVQAEILIAPGAEGLRVLIFALVIAATLWAARLYRMAMHTSSRAQLAAPFIAAMLGQAIGLGLYLDDTVLARPMALASAFMRSMYLGNPRAGWATTDRLAPEVEAAAQLANLSGAISGYGMEISPGLVIPWLLGALWYIIYFIFSILAVRRATSRPPRDYRAVWDE